MGKKNKKARVREGSALLAALEHFKGHQSSELVSFRRSFPGTARADLQRALEGLLAGSQLLGLCRQWMSEALKFADLLDQEQAPVMIGPVQFDEVDIGEPEPLRCLHQGMWLIPGGLAVMLSQAPEHAASAGPLLEVMSSPEPACLEAGARLLKDLESAMAEARTYRGKVLSLEGAESYRGTTGAVRVHKLAAVRRDEVVLPEKTLALLERNVHEFIQQRESLRRLKMQVKKGLLFYGPPGTGKTHTIRYLASQLPEHTTFLITAEQVGRLANYLSFARLLQPAIVVIEDVDLIARKRGWMGGAREEILLNQLLNEMDGLRADSEILFILTTNRPEDLEEALSSRPGRIDQAIEFPLPDERGRTQLLKLYSGGLKLGSAVVKEAVKRTQGVSAAFIKELMRRACQNMLCQGASELTLPHLREALEEMVFQGGSLNLKLLGASQLGAEP